MGRTKPSEITGTRDDDVFLLLVFTIAG